MRILVTGGAGFIGSHLCERLLRDGHEVSVVDELNDYYSPALKQQNLATVRRLGAVAFHACDICDQRSMLQILATHPRTRSCIWRLGRGFDPAWSSRCYTSG